MFRNLAAAGLIWLAFALGKGWITVPDFVSPPPPPPKQFSIGDLFMPPAPPPQTTVLDEAKKKAAAFLRSDSGICLMVAAGAVAASFLLGRRLE